MTSLLDSSLSLFSIPVIYIAALVPGRMRVNAINKKIGYNNLTPRRNIERLEKDPSVDKEFINWIVKLEGCHLNGLEAFPLWSISVLVGNFAGLDNRTLNICSALYVAGRFVYTYFYLFAKTRGQSLARTGVWVATMGIALYVIVHSAIIRSSLQPF